MAGETLHELYVEELRDLYSAENQILKALPKMIKAATHKDLKRGFTLHERQTRGQVKRLDRIFKLLGKSPRGKKCVGMEGVLKEGADLIRERPEANVLDAGLISKAQHVEHYEMAGYGSVRTWAEIMGHFEQVELLQATLDEETETNHALTKLALDTVNDDAEKASEKASEKAPAKRGSPSAKGQSTNGRRNALNGGAGARGADQSLVDTAKSWF
jgi:ferritin-like metal-binding protein YciE